MDSTQKYQALYGVVSQMSTGYRQADQISHHQYIRADSAYRSEYTQAGSLSTRLVAQTAGRLSAEASLTLATNQLAKLRGRTWVGRSLRVGRNVLAGVGGLVIVVVTLKFTW